jgi:predicted alpha/beta-fold hydrolase
MASIKLRRPFVKKQAAAMLENSREFIVDAGDGVRLQGFHSPHGDAPRDLVILLHGWEGGSDSIYLLSLAGHLFNQGYDIFRLNMRDHGTSHHLNRELFHSCRLGEVQNAVKRIREDYLNGGKCYLCGFSLGGNFALRIASKAPEAGLVLDRVVAVCPVLHPPATLDALENGTALYHWYFIRKWKKSLLKKKALFPGDYDFSDRSAFRNLTAMTEWLVTSYTEYTDVDIYLNGYSLLNGVLSGLTVPSHIILSKDDPMVPHSDLAHMDRSESLTVTLTDWGGHCGFINGPSLDSWINSAVAESLAGHGHG